MILASQFPRSFKQFPTESVELLDGRPLQFPHLFVPFIIDLFFFLPVVHIPDSDLGDQGDRQSDGVSCSQNHTEVGHGRPNGRLHLILIAFFYPLLVPFLNTEECDCV